ncbi:MAG TPA: glycosyltransferase family 9 protein [Phnomibacter sp.]|nr:glycosyltransferase family 9 protein [Phnomibacter sp.]
MPKFLIIRFSSIGDIVLTTPVIRCLKTQVPDAEVHFLTRHSFKAILEHNPYIDHLHLMKDDLSVVIKNLQAYKFDYIIDLHHNLRTLRVKRGLHAPHFSFNKLNIEKWMATALKINRLPAVHIVDRYMATLESFGVVNDGLGLNYFLATEDLVKTSDIPTSHSAGYIGVVIGAALATKKMPIHKLKEICAGINHPIILLGGPEDKAAGEEIAAIDNIKIYNACGKFKLNESADLVKKARFIISHDTGLMHIAAAFQKPIISMWGNTIPAFGMGPYYGHQAVKHQGFEVQGLRCRPCSKIGYKKCPKGHFKCMELQSVPGIIATAHQWIEAK